MLGKQFGDNQFTWLMQWAYYGIREAKEDKVIRNPVGARSLEGLGALGRLALRVFCYSYIPTLFFSGSFDLLEGSEEVFRRVLQFLLR